jgi:hypothetical protein
MDVVDLIPASELRLKWFRKDKKLLPDHLLRQPCY